MFASLAKSKRSKRSRFPRTRTFTTPCCIKRRMGPRKGRYGTPKGALPTIYAFRVKDASRSLDPTPSFALLEVEDEIQAWQQILNAPVSLNDDGHITDAPLLR